MLAGDVRSAEESFAAFFRVWQRWGVLPERYYYEGGGSLHPTEDYYPLRPELLESAFYLHQVLCICLEQVSCQHELLFLSR